jgi:S-(hydroxymethyl)glutathione dehydrogenase / alcohol dehydrogenase
MRAAVFHKPKDIRYETVPDPVIEHPRDAIIRVTSTAICGSDLHIYNGYFPQFKSLVMGHEFMGVVEEVGGEVRNLRRGDRVVVPFPIACGTCFYCRHGVPVGCENSNPDHFGPQGGVLTQKGGGLFGYTDLYGGYSGGQAEFVRVPFADYGPRKVPAGMSDEQVLFLTDILPTGWSGVEWAGVQGGETVAVFGCGPVGLMAQKCAWVRGAERVIGVDILPYRLNMAREVCNSEVVNGAEGDAVEQILALTAGHGADVVIEAVGMEADRSFLEKVSDAVHLQAGSIKVLRQCMSAVRRGGRISILGVYGTNYDNFPLGQWIDKGVMIRAGQAPVHNYIDQLMDLVATGRIVLGDIITHSINLADVTEGYRVFNAKEENCVKVVMKP